jgi:hypothetical protein
MKSVSDVKWAFAETENGMAALRYELLATSGANPVPIRPLSFSKWSN